MFDQLLFVFYGDRIGMGMSGSSSATPNFRESYLHDVRRKLKSFPTVTALFSDILASFKSSGFFM